MNPSRIIVSVVTALLLGSAIGSAQPSSASDPLDRLGFMIGTWEGSAEGKPGKSTVRREYTRVLKSKFIRAVHWSEYPPQEKNPKGEIHEDEGFFSFDRARKRLVFRQFHVEGFVSTYAEEPDATPMKIVFASEALENIPPGYRARETYLVHGPDEIEEVFELAAPGKAFETYSRTRLKRVK
jgi:hypothetical protein